MTRFEWDERKNLSNQRKHGIAFQEASAVFGDPQAILHSDRVVDDEERSHITGLLRGTVLVTVVHTVHDEAIARQVIRIISARTATRWERESYEAQNGFLYSGNITAHQ